MQKPQQKLAKTWIPTTGFSGSIMSIDCFSTPRWSSPLGKKTPHKTWARPESLCQPEAKQIWYVFNKDTLNSKLNCATAYGRFNIFAQHGVEQREIVLVL